MRVQVAAAREESAEIQLTLPDGSTKAAIRGVTTPLDVANQLSKSLAKKVVVADVDGGKWDLFRPLERDCRLQLYTFEDAKGKDVSPRIIRLHTYVEIHRSWLCW